MTKKPTYEGLEKAVKGLEAELAKYRGLDEALNEKIAELNTFINNIPDMAWIKDTQSRFIAVNRALGFGSLSRRVNLRQVFCFWESGG